MAVMALSASGRRNRRGSAPSRPRRRVRTLLVVLLALPGWAACSADPAEPPPPTAASVPLQVRTVAATGALDEGLRRRLEADVGEMLSEYVVNAFLGRYPRQGFVRSFDSFTSEAARYAVRDIGVLTAAPLADARSVRATKLEAGMSFLIHDGDVIGATATVRFRFAATLADGDAQPISLRGRLMLREDDDTWSIFGYDLARDDGAATRQGASR